MLVAFLSDFGPDSPFVGIVKGVIKSVNEAIEIIDLSHNITPFDVFEGSLVLSAAIGFFPKDTVFLAVIDPGVGSNRRAIIVRSTSYWFVLPDNGLISLVRDKEKLLEAYEIDTSKFERVSNTFHARDIFGPVAGAIASGVYPNNFGMKIPLEMLTYFNLPQVKLSENSKEIILEGEVIYVDRFGNLITNVTERDIKYLLKYSSPEKIRVRIWEEGSKPYEVISLSSHYDTSKEVVALIDSFGYLEIAVPQGNASEKLNLRKGAKVKVFAERKKS